MAYPRTAKVKKRLKNLVKQGKKTRFKPGHHIGRKPRVIELKAREFILSVINGEQGVEKLVKKIYDQAVKGSYKQQELLLNYILGKPVEKLKIERAYGSQPVVSEPVIKIIADTLRLQRLERDSEAPLEEGVVEESRIAEAERVLEDAVSNGQATLHLNGKKKS